ncbi:M24 family metallopeptidase [Candidatus Pacearchaeota archaeon]|nr:M24 family metallopeptidase [Candidatus Pacearchaeota archaeon]
MWSKEIINRHLLACKLLSKVKDEIIEFIRNNKNTSEYEIQQFILKKFKENDIISDKEPPIVGFNENSAIPHYFPNKDSKKLENNSLILIDIWAKINKKGFPFSDITWMAYYGNDIPKDILNVFNIVVNARDSCIKFIQSELKKGKMPIGKEIDEIARDVIIKAGYEKNILHKTGHCIGFTSPHGIYGNIRLSNKSQLVRNLGYTIEPGIYLKNKFGIRSEIDFYIDDNMKLIITTPIQKEIVRI